MYSILKILVGLKIAFILMITGPEQSSPNMDILTGKQDQQEIYPAGIILLGIRDQAELVDLVKPEVTAACPSKLTRIGDLRIEIVL